MKKEMMQLDSSLFIINIVGLLLIWFIPTAAKTMNAPGVNKAAATDAESLSFLKRFSGGDADFSGDSRE